MKAITFKLRCVKKWSISFIAVLAIVVSIGIFSPNTVNAEEDLNDLYPLGGMQENPNEFEELPSDEVDMPTDIGGANELPNIVDLSSKFPVPGDQGNLESCTSWAVAYAMKSYQESTEHGWSTQSSKTQFSPSYIHNQIPHYLSGTSIKDAMDCIINKGVCSIYYMSSSSSLKPTSLQNEIASNFKAIKRYSVKGVQKLKKELAKGNCAIINIGVYPDFDNISNSNAVYDKIYGEYRGRHNICVVGYDDSKQAFKFINSWGTNWGINGYGYISYKMFNDSRNCDGYAYLMVDNTDQHYKKQFIGVKALKDVNIYNDTTLENKVGVISKDSSIKITGFIKASNGNPPVFKVSNGYITTKKDSVKEVNTFTVNYQSNGGSGHMSNTVIPFDIPTATNKNAFSKSGYTFVGWHAKRDSDNKWYYEDKTTNKTGWYLEGKQPNGYIKYTYKNGSNVARTSPVNKDIVRFYAQWKENTYTIIYNSNGGTGSMDNTIVSYGIITNLRTNAFKRTGYTFKGWSVQRKSDSKWVYINRSTGKKAWYIEGKQPKEFTKYLYTNNQSTAGKFTTVNKDTVNLYAQWQAQIFTITYDSNDGKGNMNDTVVTFDTLTATNKNAFSKSGYTFAGWYAKRHSDNKWYYENKTTNKTGWYLEGKQPSGYAKYIYKNGSNVARTSPVDKDVVIFIAQWKKNS